MRNTPTTFNSSAVDQPARSMTPSISLLSREQLLDIEAVSVFARHQNGAITTVVELIDARGLVLARTVLDEAGDRELDWPFDAAGVQAWLATGPGEGEVLPRFTHVLTHLDLLLTPVRVRLPAGSALAQGPQLRWPEGRWVARAELAAYGLPAPVRKLLDAAVD